jgi:YHS domain-containing protein/uncharacterized membrane protein YraQ (UPF0718 family)
VADVIAKVGDGLWNAVLMAWEVWWALVLGFAISAIVQAWVPRERVERALAGTGCARGPRDGARRRLVVVLLRAIAIAKSLFQKGASAASALAFQFASTNLVWELGLVLWVLIGWQFTLAEYLGGLVMIALMWLPAALFVSPRDEAVAREHAVGADAGHQHHAVARAALARAPDLGPGLVGRRAQLPRRLADAVEGDPQRLPARRLHRAAGRRLLQRPLPRRRARGRADAVGRGHRPVIAVLSFVCSVGNVPLAAVLWSGGLSFAGVMAFIFADLIVLPIVSPTASTTAPPSRCGSRADAGDDDPRGAPRRPRLQRLGLIPEVRPTTGDVFGSIELDYKFVLNVFATLIFVALIGLTMRRGAVDPVCGMSVDRATALRLEHDGHTYWFCSEHCRAAFAARASGREQAHDGAHAHDHDHAAQHGRV